MKTTTTATSKILVPAARVSLAATAMLILSLASLHVLSPEYDPSWRVVSEYALGEYAWVLSLMFIAGAVSDWSLAIAIWSQMRTTTGRIGVGFLVASGVGSAMASVFAINHPLHTVAGVIGILSLPIAAPIISVQLSRTQPWSDTKTTLLYVANLTWISVIVMFAALIIMIIQFTQAGGDTTAPVKTLPSGVLPIVGYANRFLILVHSAWVSILALQAIKLQRRAVALRQSFA